MTDRLPKRIHLQVVAAVLQAIAELESWGCEHSRSIDASADGAWVTTTVGHPMPSTELLARANERYRKTLEAASTKGNFTVLTGRKINPSGH